MELDKYSRVGIAILVFFLLAATLYSLYTYAMSPDVYHFQRADIYEAE